MTFITKIHIYYYAINCKNVIYFILKFLLKFLKLFCKFKLSIYLIYYSHSENADIW